MLTVIPTKGSLTAASSTTGKVSEEFFAQEAAPAKITRGQTQIQYKTSQDCETALTSQYKTRFLVFVFCLFVFLSFCLFAFPSFCPSVY